MNHDSGVMQADHTSHYLNDTGSDRDQAMTNTAAREHIFISSGFLPYLMRQLEF
jgi:hypothetical protein